MEKRTFCTEHFVMGCKLCGGGDTNPTPETPVFLPNPEAMQQSIAPSVLTLPTGPIISAPLFESEEAKEAISVTEEYAKACDEYDSSVKDLKALEDHVRNLQRSVEELKVKVSEKKNNRSELKKKVLETLEKD